MGKDKKDGGSSPTGDAPPEKKVDLPPARSIFQVHVPAACDADRSEVEGAPRCRARIGELLSGMETPCFTVLTSRGMPFHLRPEVMTSVLGGGRQLWQVPIGDAFMRMDSVRQCPDESKGCRGFWPHLENQPTYCSFRNVRLNPSIYGGDAACSVETTGGRRKIGVKEWLDVQRVMRMDIIAAPAEDVPLDVNSGRRVHRSVSRAKHWLQEILEAKATDETLAFDWHVLATIQGCGDPKARQKACASAAAMPVAGFVIGSLGYDEALDSRARVLRLISGSLPAALPRFLPLNKGTPIEVLQGVLLGMDVFELTYPLELAWEGIALTFSSEMPAEAANGPVAAELLTALLSEEAAPLPLHEKSPGKDCIPEAKLASEAGMAKEDAPLSVSPAREATAASSASAAAVRQSVKQLLLTQQECREDFGPISEDSAVRQYSRAYLHLLVGSRELAGQMVLAQHNLDLYVRFFKAIRGHIRGGTLEHFAAWFLKTQTCEPPANPVQGPASKRRKTWRDL